MKILLLEDDIILNELLCEFLTSLGYEVDMFFDGEQALSILYEHTYDMLLLDVNVPHISGFEIVKDIRSNDIQTPVIFLTSLNDTASVVEGFDSGGDEYIKKPFDLEELEIRINNIKKRFGLDLMLKVGENTLFDTALGVLIKFLGLENEQQIQLPPKESALLKLLISNSDKLVSYEMMYSNIWINEDPPSSATIRTYIKNLRRYTSRIQTVKGVGYVFLSFKK